ncbi:nucleotidyl transferase AbiEii/AbiGii toxin family protein [Amycolatopsis benzoatilytica]|uniref:nucleotidyl transferase AbiEii/AbiGii toxin family protein n=1 Tax=Amycolatopsis benzoatilytica TaxID=346045 RepID=UPI0004879512
MLAPDELREVASRFGVDETQVRRDHLISHLLAAVSATARDSVIFFGGTALARSLVPDGRLSEDVDLIAVGRRTEVAERLDRAIPRALRREYPGLTWAPSLIGGRDTDPAILHSPDGLAVRVQLLNAVGYPRWPTEELDLVQRYSDASAAVLTVPTAAGFVAAKTAAWHDRAAARDLWDLWALAERGHLTEEAADLYARVGPTNRRPDPAAFSEAPSEDRWRRDLGGQVRLTVTAADALAVVRKSWARLTEPG